MKRCKVKAPYKIINLYITYATKLWQHHDGTSFPLIKSLFEAVKVTKNSDTSKYFYSRCGISFDTLRKFSLADDSVFGKNVIMFDIDNRNKDILNLGKGPT